MYKLIQGIGASRPTTFQYYCGLIRTRRRMNISAKGFATSSLSEIADNASKSETPSLSIFDAVSGGQMQSMTVERIRNFSVIAHIDHGKSTLSDCILQITGNISDADRKRGQVLDTLKVERERGITVKAQTASMIYVDTRSTKHEPYLLNLIDTPGHIDFSYEVSRSLASCQGALLLVDSTQSIQAQTLANFEKAKNLGLTLIPIVTKIDLPNAQPEETALAMATAFQLDPDSVIMTSAKKRIGIEELMHAIIDRLPPPPHFDSNIEKAAAAGAEAFRGRIVDSWFDEHRGVVCLVQVVSGKLSEGQVKGEYTRMTLFASVKESKDIDNRSEFSVQEIGILTPTTLRTTTLCTGQVGYVIAGLRSTRQARIGDTMYVPAEWVQSPNSIVPLSGYESSKPMLFASVYPVDSVELEALFAAVDRLCLNDSSITVTRDHSVSLGLGLRCGFLGFLHMEVFNQRLKDEFNMDIVMTTPSVPYIINYDGDERRGIESSTATISCVSDWPVAGSRNSLSFSVMEPMVKVVLVSPKDFYGAMVDLVKERRGTDMEVQYIQEKDQVFLTALIPWQEVVCDMNDQVKHQSSGYASFNYQEAGYREADLVKVEIAVNGEVCDPLSFVSHSSKAVASGRSTALKLKEVLSRQQFEIILQAKVGQKIVAKERIAPYRKDVLVKGGKTVGGGDITRKKKLLAKQKEGKKRAKMVGKVEIGQEAFWAVLQR